MKLVIAFITSALFHVSIGSANDHCSYTQLIGGWSHPTELNYTQRLSANRVLRGEGFDRGFVDIQLVREQLTGNGAVNYLMQVSELSTWIGFHGEVGLVYV